MCFIYFSSQVLTWLIIPNLNVSAVTNTNNILQSIIFFQYLPRVFLIFPLTSKIVEATGIVTETAWAGAAYNLLLFMLASHVSTFWISVATFFMLNS